jgi:hypothetical protein
MDNTRQALQIGSPDIAALFYPASVLTRLSPAALAARREAVESAEKEVEGLLRLFLTFELERPPHEVLDGEVQLQGGREEWLAALDAIRQTAAAFNGTASRALIREVSRTFPERAPEMIRLFEAAREHAAQILTWIAFMLGEDDELGRQRQLIPTDQVERPPGPSVKFSLG